MSGDWIRKCSSPRQGTAVKNEEKGNTGKDNYTGTLLYAGVQTQKDTVFRLGNAH